MDPAGRRRKRMKARFTCALLGRRAVRHRVPSDSRPGFGEISLLCEGPFFSCSRGRDNSPTTSTRLPSSALWIGQRHLDAALRRVRRNRRQSKVRLASKVLAQSICEISNQFPAQPFPDGFLIPQEVHLPHLCHLHYALMTRTRRPPRSCFCRFCIAHGDFAHSDRGVLLTVAVRGSPERR